MKEVLVSNLKSLLANKYALFLKTQNYHWNIESPNFYSLHKFFGELYEDLYHTIDDLAEIIRIMGEKVPGNFEFFISKTFLKSADENSYSDDIINELISDYNKITGYMEDILQLSQEIGDEVVSDYLIGRISVCKKFGWMLKSMKY